MAERKYTKICVFCGKPFPTPSAAARYCSDQCREDMAWERARQKDAVRTCPQCGKQFIKAGTFCSRDCYYAALKAGWKKTDAARTEALCHNAPGSGYEAPKGMQAEALRTDEAHPAEPEPEGLCQDDAHPEGRHPEVLRQGIQWEPWRACRDVPEKTEEWGVSPESMSGYRNPTDEEKAAFLGIKMVPFLDISLILLLAAIGFFMFYLPPACLVISAICLACICCILRHAVYMGEIRQMFSSGLFQVMECRADAVYPGDPSALVLIHNAAGQYCSKVFELGKRDVQKIRRDPGRTLLLARCGGKKMHYRLFLQKNQKLLEKS